MTKFSDALSATATQQNLLTRTENGALTFSTTKSAVLDLFAMGGALRSRSDADIESLVQKAFTENPLITLRTLFYLRDARGGQGERRTFRVGMSALANLDPDRIKANLAIVPTFGRFDDLLSLIGTSLQNEALEVIKEQFNLDVTSSKPSLLAKWLPSENASSKETKKNAKIVATFLGLTPKNYRKALTSLRSKLNVVEKAMCQREFSRIEYSKVPSVASLRYRKAFAKRDPERYEAFRKALVKGEAKINAGTLYPYDLVCAAIASYDATVEAQWKALPNYMEGEEDINALVMADVSGSMGLFSGVTPMSVCISLALYISERAKGPFKDTFMTFSGSPSIQKVVGSTLKQKIVNLTQAHWSTSTNLQAAFDTILNTAIASNCTQEDLPKTLIVISDMEFNSCTGRTTNYQEARNKFEQAGYTLPEVVFWNVAARNNQSPVTRNAQGVFLVSGASPSIMKAALNTKVVTPYDMMLDVVNSPRYSVVI